MISLNFLRPKEEAKLLSLTKPLIDDIVIRLPLKAGVGPGEIADLQVSDVCYEYNLLFVWRSKVSRDHPAIVDSQTMFKISQIADKRKNGPLLPLEGTHRMKVQLMRRIVKKWALKAGLARWWRVTPYTLRHTFCIKWTLAKGDLESLRRQLGHRSLEKLRHYLDFDYSDVRREYARIFEGHMAARAGFEPAGPNVPYVV